MPFLKRGEGIARFAHGGLAQARADALARAPRASRQSASVEEPARPRPSAYNMAAEEVASDESAAHLALPVVEAPTSRGTEPAPASNFELTEFEELEAAVRRCAPRPPPVTRHPPMSYWAAHSLRCPWPELATRVQTQRSEGLLGHSGTAWRQWRQGERQRRHHTRPGQ